MDNLIDNRWTFKILNEKLDLYGECIGWTSYDCTVKCGDCITAIKKGLKETLKDLYYHNKNVDKVTITIKRE